MIYIINNYNLFLKEINKYINIYIIKFVVLWIILFFFLPQTGLDTTIISHMNNVAAWAPSQIMGIMRM